MEEEGLPITTCRRFAGRPAACVAPHCGSYSVRFMESVRRWKCYEKHPCPQFSIKTGTIFEDSNIAVWTNGW